MSFLQPTPTPYDPFQWGQLPFTERARLVCQAWAVQGYGAPLVVIVFYAVKIALYAAVWLMFCSFTPSLGGLSNIGTWWLEPIAFQKAILWSMLFEGLGLGCGSGPLTGRYYPPFGGFMYFLRPGTTKLALFPGVPLFGGYKRTWLDAGLYAALVISLVRALVAPVIEPALVWPIVILLPLASIGDRMLFLTFRGEHYWTAAACFALVNPWIGAAKSIWLALWFWAGISKLNHHFPAVVCVMTSNSPIVRSTWLRKRLYRSYPDDLRPSRLAVWMAHAGTVLELGVPTIMLLTPLGVPPVLGIIAMLALHGFITSNVPMGVPLEWNVMMVYGAFALFWAHADVAPFAVGSPVLAAVLVLMLVLLPLFGNLFPDRISFLLSMRYYAGNWACSQWFIRLDGAAKLEKLKRAVETVDKQIGRFFDPNTAAGLFSRGMGFRLMHLHGRAITTLIPKTLPVENHYVFVDGEGMAGMILGWNFGDGHLHNEGLLSAVQAQCEFLPGELRCIFVESQPLFRKTLAYRIVDAASGLIEQGELQVSDLREMQPWGSAKPAAVVEPQAVSAQA